MGKHSTRTVFSSLRFSGKLHLTHTRTVSGAKVVFPSKVTVGIPTLNRSSLLTRAVQSALAQSYGNIEVLVSDDVSTDDTLSKLRKIADPRLVVHAQEQRLGLVGNFDFCLRRASGEFFLLLGDDDVLEPRAIECLIQPFLAVDGGSVGMTWCPCHIVNMDGTKLWQTEMGPEKESAASMVTALWAGKRGPRLSGILLRTEDCLRAGGYQEKYGDLCDIGLWAKVALSRPFVCCLPDILVQYTNHHGSITSKSAVQQWQAWANVVHEDLVATARLCKNNEAEELIQRAQRNFLRGITLTILIQTIGRPGWIGNAVLHVLRNASLFCAPNVFRRLFHDGWKVLMLRQQRLAEGTRTVWTSKSRPLADQS
jgi:hypothetical protein